MVLNAFFKLAMFNRSMRSLARDMGLNYTQTLVFRPPKVNGFYNGRDVVVDTFEKPGGGDRIRVRVFHSGELSDEFTVGSKEFFEEESKGAAIPLESDNTGFTEGFRVSGGDRKLVRKFLDADLQERIVSSGLSFMVGKYYVQHVSKDLTVDKDRIVRALDLLVEAASRADTL
ncbi:MAG: hypothetical protein GF416_03455 [Candidatus Altiarchaeales archaeon]|nr:hypothetical protein [Candidatus Altiarchaeales archaeon]MBD3416176.1 hypothetical protein [Candidatus Altiarchaeales archaeon]